MATIVNLNKCSANKQTNVNSKKGMYVEKSKIIKAEMHISQVDDCMIDTFKKIDKNKDKTVTAEEIKQFKEEKTAQIGFGTIGACLGGVGLAAAPAYTGAAAIAVGCCGGGLILCGIGLIYCGFKAINSSK